MIDFSTLVEDGQVWHASLDGAPLQTQPNATFAHRLDWFDRCTFCDDVFTACADELRLQASAGIEAADATDPAPRKWSISPPGAQAGPPTRVSRAARTTPGGVPA